MPNAKDHSRTVCFLDKSVIKTDEVETFLNSVKASVLKSGKRAEIYTKACLNFLGENNFLKSNQIPKH